jgi:hypothetical protein
VVQYGEHIDLNMHRMDSFKTPVRDVSPCRLMTVHDTNSFFHLAAFLGSNEAVFQVSGINPFNRNAFRAGEPIGALTQMD